MLYFLLPTIDITARKLRQSGDRYLVVIKTPPRSSSSSLFSLELPSVLHARAVHSISMSKSRGQDPTATNVLAGGDSGKYFA